MLNAGLWHNLSHFEMRVCGQYINLGLLYMKTVCAKCALTLARVFKVFQGRDPLAEGGTPNTKLHCMKLCHCSSVFSDI